MYVVARQQSLRSQAVDQLRGAIVTGKLEPGSMHSEQSIAADMAISRTPIREALLHLASEGLVEFVPNAASASPSLTPSISPRYFSFARQSRDFAPPSWRSNHEPTH